MRLLILVAVLSIGTKSLAMFGLKGLSDHFNNMAWLNPVPDDHWDYTSSVCILRDLFDNRMYPLTLKGLEDGMSELSK
jgi:uncharacterized protein with von Willebrand factor type A (vWA) domain